MAEVQLPTRDEWKTFKTKYGVDDGAAKGVDLGPELDKYWKIARAPATKVPQLIAARTHLEEVFVKYVQNVDMKKVKDQKFKQAFLDGYLGVAHKLNEDMKRYKTSAASYRTDLGKFAMSVQSMKKGEVTKGDFEKFNQGPQRGLSASGSRLTGFDVHGIDAILGQINKAIQTMKVGITRTELDAFLVKLLAAAKDVAQEAINAGIAEGEFHPVQPHDYF